MSNRTKHTLPRKKQPPKYAAAVVQLGRELLTTKGPGVHHVTVEHDDWCAIFQGQPCNCNPDIKAGKPGRDRAN